jgi:hypothetical protein
VDVCDHQTCVLVCAVRSRLMFAPAHARGTRRAGAPACSQLYEDVFSGWLPAAFRLGRLDPRLLDALLYRSALQSADQLLAAHARRRYSAFSPQRSELHFCDPAAISSVGPLQSTRSNRHYCKRMQCFIIVPALAEALKIKPRIHPHLTKTFSDLLVVKRDLLQKSEVILEGAP